MRTFLVAAVVLGGGVAAAAPAGRATAAPAVRATATVAAACGPDYLERHATTVSDLDGDGTLDRVAFVREADGIAVHLYALPGLTATASWKLPSGYLEVATPRRRGTTRGDLWITVGASIGKTDAWAETLYHLEGGKLAELTTAARQQLIRLDVDGDGRVDPIGIFGAKVRALLATGAWLDLPAVIPSQLHGVPVAPVAGQSVDGGQEEAFDLDGNGVRELVVEGKDGLDVIEVPSGKRVWSIKGQVYQPRLVRWDGAIVLVVRLDDHLRIYATDAKHALIAAYPDAPSYATASTALGPQLVMTGLPWRFYDRAAPTKVASELHHLVGRLDDAAAPFGPLRLVAADPPGLLAAVDDPTAPFELRLVDPQTHAVRRRVWTSDRPTSISRPINASLVDLDRDGAAELLLEDVERVAFHHGTSWDSSRLRLLDGRGRLLWQEPATRTEEWTHGGDDGHGEMRQIRFDGTHVRAFDLGDGTTPLRIRSARDEYYLLAARSKLTAIPPCLE